MDWSRLIERMWHLDRLPIPITILVISSSSVFLFAPQSWLTALHLDGAKETLGLWFGLAFLLSAILLPVQLAARAWAKLKRSSAQADWLSKVNQAAKSLDRDEKTVLREFSVQGRRTLALPINAPIIAGLVRKGILERVSNFSDGGLNFAMAITDDAYQFLSNELIDLPKDPTPSNIEWVRKERDRVFADWEI